MPETPTPAKPCGCRSADTRTHAPTLSCERCLDAHIGFAAVLAQEVAEDAARLVERRLAIGNLKAAEWHARALGLPAVAQRARAARHALADGDAAPAVALLSVDTTPPPPTY